MIKQKIILSAGVVFALFIFTALFSLSAVVPAEDNDADEAADAGAWNLLISSDGNGTVDVHFINNNSRTRLDPAGERNETTELVGDFYVPGASGKGMMPGGQELQGEMGDLPNKGNYLNAYFEDSEWKGTVVGVSRNASLTFDAGSSWDVTADTTIGTLTVAAGTVIKAERPVTITCTSLVDKDKGKFTLGKNVKINFVKTDDENIDRK